MPVHQLCLWLSQGEGCGPSKKSIGRIFWSLSPTYSSVKNILWRKGAVRSNLQNGGKRVKNEKIKGRLYLNPSRTVCFKLEGDQM